MDIAALVWIALSTFCAASIAGGIVLYRNASRSGLRAWGMSGIAAGVALLLVVLLTVPMRTDGEQSDPTIAQPDTAVQLPAPAQTLIEASKKDLAERLGMPADDIRLESITTPAEADGTYVIKLLAVGRLHEYHGRDGAAVFYSEHVVPKPESTEGGRRVSVLRRQEGAPVLLG